MAEKNFNNVRIVNKHDTDANWLKATGFTPKQGEIIVYDIDSNCNYERIKIGDGIKNVNALPFVDDALRTELLGQIDAVDDKVDAVSALVGDTSVSEQIEAAAEVYVGPTRPTDSNIKVWINTSEEGTGVVPIIPIVSSVALPASGWTGYNPYSQTVDVPSASSTSMITLQPSAQQILDLQNEEITMTVENDGNGNITFYCINGVPSFDMNMQILISAVAYA
jgi:hypothetical protein